MKKFVWLTFAGVAASGALALLPSPAQAQRGV